MLGAALHLGLVDLGVWVEPRLGSGLKTRPWAGLFIVVVLATGLGLTLGLAGQGGLWLFEQAVPHREVTP